MPMVVARPRALVPALFSLTLALFGPTSLAAASARADAGQRIFQRACAGCHGPAGEGARGPTLAVPRLARAKDRESLLDIIDDGIEGTEMPAARLPKPELNAVADYVARLGRKPRERVPGDAERGRAVYLGKGGCAVCHSIAGTGGAYGPDLTDIGARRGAAHLRSALLQPEAALPKASSPYRPDVNIAQNFLQVRAVTADGTEITGVRVNEDTFSIQLREVGGRLHSFWKDELRELHKDWGRSPMPSYEEALAPGELDDLVAFLLSLRGTDVFAADAKGKTKRKSKGHD